MNCNQIFSLSYTVCSRNEPNSYHSLDSKYEQTTVQLQHRLVTRTETFQTQTIERS